MADIGQLHGDYAELIGYHPVDSGVIASQFI
jgi:hypothetical protein